MRISENYITDELLYFDTLSLVVLGASNPENTDFQIIELARLWGASEVALLRLASYISGFHAAACLMRSTYGGCCEYNKIMKGLANPLAAERKNLWPVSKAAAI